MRTTFLYIVLCVLLATCLVSSNASAQGSSAAVEKPPSGGPRRQLGTIIYAGLGGAVLGLSTLSFYGRPQDKLANIAIGFAVGVISGTAAVTYSAATNPDDFYGSQNSLEIKDDRSRTLGPAPSMSVVTTREIDESSPGFLASYPIVRF